MLLNKSAIRKFIKLSEKDKKDFYRVSSVSDAMWDKLNERVKELVLDSLQRARDNHRKTLQPRDI